MRRYIVMVWVLVLVLPLFADAAEIEWKDIGGGNSDIWSVLVDADNPAIIYMGTKNAVMKSVDAGESWRNVLVVKGRSQAVNFLFQGEQGKKSLYAATGSGLFFSPDYGRSWKRIFKGKNYLESQCTSIAVLSGVIYLGTKGGLFASSDHGRSWQRQQGEIENSYILAITCSVKEPAAVYVASAKGVFKIGIGVWEKVFVAHLAENEDSPEADDDGRQLQSSSVRYIASGPDTPDYLYLATDRGAYKSVDGGGSWIAMPDYGLLEKEVRFLSATGGSNIYAGTRRGIFKFELERWQELSLGLVAEDIRYFSVDGKGNIYAACDNGLFKSGVAIGASAQTSRMDLYSQGEPAIEELQRAAIQYAEVDNRKIKKWRKQAAMKAYLPTFSASVNRDTGDLWHWESGSSTKTGDDVLIKGEDNLDWGVSLSWDLGEIIWNDDQTSIDVRSRLMVELRDEILDEVNKTYFERLRVRAELDNLAIEDKKKRFEKELRIKELTASLDALTGGYFSRRIKGS